MRVGEDILSVVAALLVLSSCSIIDEDNSRCGIGNKIVYKVKLATNLQSELDEQLGSAEDLPVAEVLRSSLAPIFPEKVYDLDLSFYNTDDIREKHEQHIMNASEAEYSVYLPEKDYRNLAVANIVGMDNVVFESDDDSSASMKLIQHGDTVDSHKSGVFSAREILEVCNCTDTHNVSLHMVNCCAAIVVDTAGVSLQGMKVVMHDCADTFVVRDSLYSFSSRSIVRAVEVPLPGLRRSCHYAAAFPSPDVAVKSVPYVYRIVVYALLPDGTTTENVISVATPLKAGRLQVLKMRMEPNGSLVSESRDVGISVTLDWKEGGKYEPEI